MRRRWPGACGPAELKPDLILTSPAVRALATATIMARELKVPASIFPER